MREKGIELQLTQRVKAMGGIAFKFVSPGNAGVPDRLILLPQGHMAFAELKAPGKVLRPLQKLRKVQLEKLGFKVYVIDNVDQIGGVLDEISAT